MIAMKTTKAFGLATVLLLAAGSALAQNYYLATQQARRDSAQNDAEQQRIAREANGGAAAAPGGAAAPAPAQPPNPVLQATLKNISGLQTDLAAILAAGDKTGAEQKNALLNDLSQASQSTTKASSDAVKKLGDDLVAALGANVKLAPGVQTKLARNIHAMFNSAHLTTTQQEAVLKDVQKVLTDGGAPADAATTVVEDLKAVALETK
jgi:hypothetical protein